MELALLNPWGAAAVAFTLLCFALSVVIDRKLQKSGAAIDRRLERAAATIAHNNEKAVEKAAGLTIAVYFTVPGGRKFHLDPGCSRAASGNLLDHVQVSPKILFALRHTQCICDICKDVLPDHSSSDSDSDVELD